MREPPKRPTPARSEAEVLAELAAVCVRPGFVHAFAALCFRENVIFYGATVNESDLAIGDPALLSTGPAAY